MYADVVTQSMKKAIDSTDRRRDIQREHNHLQGIIPAAIQKTVRDITERVKSASPPTFTKDTNQDINKENIFRIIKDLETQMKLAARTLEFEKAALIRDEISELRKLVVLREEFEVLSS